MPSESKPKTKKSVREQRTCISSFRADSKEAFKQIFDFNNKDCLNLEIPHVQKTIVSFFAENILNVIGIQIVGMEESQDDEEIFFFFVPFLIYGGIFNKEKKVFALGAAYDEEKKEFYLARFFLEDIVKVKTVSSLNKAALKKFPKTIHL